VSVAQAPGPRQPERRAAARYTTPGGAQLADAQARATVERGNFRAIAICILALMLDEAAAQCRLVLFGEEPPSHQTLVQLH
jgi:hypothetical protein